MRNCMNIMDSYEYKVRPLPLSSIRCDCIPRACAPLRWTAARRRSLTRASFLPPLCFPEPLQLAREPLQLAGNYFNSPAREFIRDHNDPGNSVTVTCASFPSSADFRGWKRRLLLRARRRYRSHSLSLSLSLSLFWYRVHLGATVTRLVDHSRPFSLRLVPLYPVRSSLFLSDVCDHLPKHRDVSSRPGEKRSSRDFRARARIYKR